MTRRARVVAAVAATASLAGAALLGWAVIVEPGRLVVRETRVGSARWPAGRPPLRLAVLTDLHVGSFRNGLGRLDEVVARTNAQHPDLVVILGDLVVHDVLLGRFVPPEATATRLAGLRAPLGVMAVLGNHDWWYNGYKVRRDLEANGIKILENEVVRLDVRGTPLWLAGLADLWTRVQRVEQTIAQVPDGETVIALTHNPDIFPQLPQRVPLMLAGHTHGGQVRLPFIGSVVEASRFGERYEVGHVFENGHHLFVTTGIGTSIVPVRFGVPPEIVLLEVKTAG